ncbi:MAG: hypothetical protein RLP44_29905 [Aggregatilineales bacterium]
MTLKVHNSQLYDGDEPILYNGKPVYVEDVSNLYEYEDDDGYLRDEDGDYVSIDQILDGLHQRLTDTEGVVDEHDKLIRELQAQIDELKKAKEKGNIALLEQKAKEIANKIGAAFSEVWEEIRRWLGL